jgi:hypothetical protein
MWLHRGVRRDARIFSLDSGRLMGDPIPRSSVAKLLVQGWIDGLRTHIAGKQGIAVGTHP